MFKEDGYDEYLAEQLKLAQRDYQEGHFYTLAEAKKLSEQALERKVQELVDYENGVVVYG